MYFYQASKSGLIFFVYLHMVSHQSVFSFSSSNSFACFAELGILMSNFCVLTKYFDFIFPMMRVHFASTCRIHHTNEGSPAIRRCTAYSAICTGYELFISLRVAHVVLPSFHWARTSTPSVVSLWRFVLVRIVMNVSCSFTSVPPYLWSTISWNRTCQFPSPLI